MKPTVLLAALERALASTGSALQPALLALIRVYWGWSFILTGRGKLLHLERTTEFFASLHLPAPQANAILAGATECLGGLLLALGFGTRLACVPLLVTMAVAYATAEREALAAFFSDPDKFTGAAPFLFLFAVVLVFAFGPGAWSVDGWRARARRAAAPATQTFTTRVPAMKS